MTPMSTSRSRKDPHFTHISLHTRLGGVGMRIVVALCTLAVLASVIILLLRHNMENQAYHRSNALVIAEYGLEKALSILGENPRWSDGFKETEYRGGTYAVELDRMQKDSLIVLHVLSIGMSGPHTRKVERFFKRPAAAPDSGIWSPQ